MWFSPLLQGAGQQQASAADGSAGVPIAGIPALGGLGASDSASGNNYTLTAQGGAYALTGAAATLIRSRRIVATGGAYAVTGASAVLEKDRLLTAQGGAYSLAGGQSIIERDRRLTAQGGAYALSGGTAILTKSTPGAYVLTALGGSYQITGASATITKSGGEFADTHDGYFHNLWRKLKEKPESKVEELAERIEEIEEQIAEVKARPLPTVPVYLQSVPIPPIEAQARLLEALILESARLRRELEDEEEAEILLLL